MDAIWKKMYEEAKKVLNPRAVSSIVEAGGVAAAVLTKKGNIYVGVCIDGACTLGICAERNAIFNMITNGESEIERVLAINWDGKAMSPCGACRELISQIMPETYKDVLVMLDCEKEKVVTMRQLTPEWWI